MTATPGSSLLVNPSLFSLNWGNFVFEREYAQKMRYLEMSDDQWQQGVAGHLEAHPHNYAVRQWVARTEAARAERKRQTSQRITVETPDSDELTFRVWKDMIENPCMYGNDIVEWLTLDEEVMRGPKRWRAGAFWQIREDEETIKVENAMATRIQAAWRGYSTRVTQVWRDCAHCLKHGICVEKIGDEHVCRCCWGEANPVEDDVVAPVEEDDVWGPHT